MQEPGNHFLFVERVAMGKIQRIDPVELGVIALFDQPRNRIGDRGIGGLLQNRKRRARSVRGLSDRIRR